MSITINRNNISKIDNFMDLVLYIECRYNELTELPELPKNLQTLYCNSNNLSILPNLPES